MRLAGLAAAALALACSGQACAQVSPPAALAPGETLLEVNAVGTVKSRPDLARLFVVVKSTADSPAKARSANAALIDRVTAAARSAGVTAEDVRPSTRAWPMGFVGNEAANMALPASMRPPGKTEASTLEIALRGFTRIEAVRSAVERAGAEQVTGPAYELVNDSAARRAAKLEAIGRARTEADDYAQALGMQVVRILRVSERVTAYADPEEMQTLYAAMGVGGGSADEIETVARVAVDFALAPR